MSTQKAVLGRSMPWLGLRWRPDIEFKENSLNKNLLIFRRTTTNLRSKGRDKMTTALMTFSEVVEKAATVKAAKEGKKAFSKRDAATRPQEVGDHYVTRSDRELSKTVSQAIARLQDAMDEASRAGLIVEPVFRSIDGRFNEFGISIESYICNVEIFRKLS